MRATISLLVVACVAACAREREEPLSADAVQLWLTTPDRSKLMTREPDIPFAITQAAGSHIDVDERTPLQEIVGFGAAITDASAWLIQNRMSRAQREALLHELFGRAGGLGLSFTRLTIGASDFSRSHYTLDDVPAGSEDMTSARSRGCATPIRTPPTMAHSPVATRPIRPTSRARVGAVRGCGAGASPAPR